MAGTLLMGTPGQPPEEAAPEAFGKYRVLERLGVGGFGSVWRCMDDGLGREVAVKVLAEAYKDHFDLRERFLREARALARLNHPAVVQVFDVGETDNGPFFVMELVPGRDLGRVLAEGGPLEEGRVLRLCRQAVLGLKAAADGGVVHRDIKPANLMVTGTGADEALKVTDFGLAFPTQEDAARMTREAIILGTPEYMAPEQARGAAVDHRADMYALGCSLYELLTGRTPFVGDNPQSIIAAQLTLPPEPLRVLRPQISGPVQNLVLRLLAKEPEGRFGDHAELLAALDGLLAHVPATSAAPAPASMHVPKDDVPATSPPSEIMAVHTQNLALCFVDLLEFQERTRQQTRDENATWVGDFTDTMKKLVRSRGGRFIKQAYGTVLCTFQSPTDAVHFGMAAVDAAWSRSQGKPPLMTYNVRVGINLGEVRMERGDVFGDPVNVAARVMAKAEPGTVWFSDAVYLAMNRTEAEGESTGAHELKGVPVPVRLFRALPPKGHTPGPGKPPFGVKKATTAALDADDALATLENRARAVVHSVNTAAGAVLAPSAAAVGSAAKGVLGMLPAAHRKKAVASAAVLVTATAGALVLTALTDPYRVERGLIDDGRAGQAVRVLETRAAESAQAQWLYGRALMLSGKRSLGMEQWEAALARDRSLADDVTRDALLDALAYRDEQPRELLVRYWGAGVKDELKDLSTSERYHARHHAAAALAALGLQADVDIVAISLKDIRMESDCSRRQSAVRALEEVGDTRALSALGAALAEPGGDADCVQGRLKSAQRRVAKRLGQGDP